jgi:hypothetical protein
LPLAPLKTFVVGQAGLSDPEDAFAAAHELEPSGAALVRPDGFVCWRAASMPADPDSALRDAMRRALCLPA